MKSYILLAMMTIFMFLHADGVLSEQLKYAKDIFDYEHIERNNIPLRDPINFNLITPAESFRDNQDVDTNNIAFDCLIMGCDLQFVFNRITKDVVAIVTSIGRRYPIPEKTPVTQAITSPFLLTPHLFPTRCKESISRTMYGWSIKQTYEEKNSVELYTVTVSSVDKDDPTIYTGIFYFHPESYWYYKFDLFNNGVRTMRYSLVNSSKQD